MQYEDKPLVMCNMELSDAGNEKNQIHFGKEFPDASFLRVYTVGAVLIVE